MNFHVTLSKQANTISSDRMMNSIVLAVHSLRRLNYKQLEDNNKAKKRDRSSAINKKEVYQFTSGMLVHGALMTTQIATVRNARVLSDAFCRKTS